MISIVYGAAVAFAQTDLKKLVAYSSVSHMGFVMLGIAAMNAEGLNGAVAVMFSHGVVTGMLFLIVGMVYDRTHTREIKQLSGLSVGGAGARRPARVRVVRLARPAGPLRLRGRVPLAARRVAEPAACRTG